MLRYVTICNDMYLPYRGKAETLESLQGFSYITALLLALYNTCTKLGCYRNKTQI